MPTLIRCPDGSIVTIPDFTGYIPDPVRQAVVDAAARPFLPELGAASTSDDIVQYLGLARSQEHGPSCVGQTVAEMVDGVRGPGHKPASAIGPWWDARRREGGGKEQVVAGTYLYMGMESAVRRGIETRVEGEDVDEAKWTRKPGLDEDMDAYDHKVSPFARYRIADEDVWLLDAIDSALHAGRKVDGVHVGHGVGYGNDVGEGYKRFSGEQIKTLREDACIGLDSIGSSTGAGHAMRIAGKRTRNGRRQYLQRGSWSRHHGLYGWWWVGGEQRYYGPLGADEHAELVSLGYIDLAGAAWCDEACITSSRARDFQVLTAAP